jgi:hypothetical protein
MLPPDDSLTAHGDFPHCAAPAVDHAIARDRRLVALWIAAAIVAATILIVTAAMAHDDGRYASSDPSVHAWYERAQLTPAAQKRLGFVGCCAHSDVVHTQFRVSHHDGADQWWWLDRGSWREVPSDIIEWGQSAPDGQPTLFAIGDGMPTCFFPGTSGQ